MRVDSPGLLLIVIGLVLVAGLLTAVEAALAGFSRARAEGLAHESRPGAKRLLVILDDTPRFLNTVLFLRLLAELMAVVLVTLMVSGSTGSTGWVAAFLTLGTMVLVSFVVIGVGPRTLGRQHAEPIALGSAPVIVGLTRVLGPVPQLLILIGNALTPGKGFSEGPVRFRGGAARAGGSRRGEQRHRVRRARDDPLGLRAR